MTVPLAARAALASTVVAAACLIFVSPAAAKRPLRTGLGDIQYVSAATEARRAFLFDETQNAAADLVRIDVGWRSVAAAGRPAAPADPSDPAYNFSDVDAAAVAAESRGLDVMFTIVGAPSWAERGRRPPGVPEGAWKPDPDKLAAFAGALARRFSGEFSSNGRILPRVRNYEIWNEPNLTNYLAPQYVGKRQVSADLYRSMLNGSYRAIKAVHRDNVVVAGATAPYGDPRGGKRTRPLVFLRKLFCLTDKRKQAAKGCRKRARFDALDHHPITFTEGPRARAQHPDDAAMGDLHKVRRVLKSAERSHTIKGARRHQLWVGEFWWFSNPPGPGGVPVRRHAQWYAQALYEIWRQGATVAIALQVQDSPDRDGLHTGLLFADGTRKPTHTAFRFPFVATKRSANLITVWGRAPSAGQVQIQRRKGERWRTLVRFQAGGGEVFERRLRVGAKPRLRAVIGGDASLVTTPR